MMQESDLLTVNHLERITNTMDDFLNEIAVQQKQMTRLVEIVQALCRHTHLSLPVQLPPEPSPEPSDTELSQPSSDAEVKNDSVQDDPHKCVNDDSDKSPNQDHPDHHES